MKKNKLDNKKPLANNDNNNNNNNKLVLPREKRNIQEYYNEKPNKVDDFI